MATRHRHNPVSVSIGSSRTARTHLPASVSGRMNPSADSTAQGASIHAQPRHVRRAHMAQMPSAMLQSRYSGTSNMVISTYVITRGSGIPSPTAMFQNIFNGFDMASTRVQKSYAFISVMSKAMYSIQRLIFRVLSFIARSFRFSGGITRHNASLTKGCALVKPSARGKCLSDKYFYIFWHIPEKVLKLLQKCVMLGYGNKGWRGIALNVLLENARNVVFDVGQVLLRFEPNEFLPRMLSPEAARVLTAKVLFECPTWSRIDQGTIEEEACAKQECRDAGVPELWPEALYAIQHYHEHMSVLPPASLLPQLRAMGKRLYVLSNYGPDGFARSEKRFADVFAQFDGMIVSGREKLIKPDPAIYQLLLSRYQLDPAQTVFIDDRAENIRVARQVGMQGIVYQGMESLM